MKPKISDYKTIAVIQTAFLGDFVLSLPLFQVIRNNAPDSKIIAVCTPISTQTASLSKAIDKIIPYDKRNKNKGYEGIKNIADELKDEQVDLIIAPHRSLRTTMLSKMSGAKFSIGFDKNALSFLYSRKVKYEITQHEILRNLSLLSAFEDINRIYNSVDLQFTDSVKTDVEGILNAYNINQQKKIIVLAPGSVWATKKWKIEHFATVAEMLTESGHKVLIIGAKEDREDAAQIVSKSGAINLCGETSIPQSIYLLSKANLLITNDSAPTHFAGLVNCPTMTIYGPTAPEFGFAPIGKHDRTLAIDNLKCRPCAIHGSKKCPLKHFDCMEKLTPKYVFENAEEVLAKTS